MYYYYNYIRIRYCIIIIVVIIVIIIIIVNIIIHVAVTRKEVVTSTRCSTETKESTETILWCDAHNKPCRNGGCDVTHKLVSIANTETGNHGNWELTQSTTQSLTRHEIITYGAIIIGGLYTCFSRNTT